ncbi:MAG: hypothetical protein OT477_07975 [Chloroflexi bacterium]|nr:hypothetical protein [Chloroflexota bacterium]
MTADYANLAGNDWLAGVETCVRVVVPGLCHWTGWGRPRPSQR